MKNISAFIILTLLVSVLFEVRDDYSWLDSYREAAWSHGRKNTDILGHLFMKTNFNEQIISIYLA